MRLAWFTFAAVLATRAPAFADDAPPPATPSTETPPVVPAQPPVTETPPAGAPPGATTPDVGDVRDFRPAPMHRDIVVTVDGDRSGQNIALCAGIAAGGALLGGLGLYYNLDSRDAAQTVSPKHALNAPWSPNDQALYDRAHSSAVKAGVFYGLGGALVIAAAITYIVTAPASETTVIHPHYARVQPIIAPSPTGALVGGAWSF